MAKQIGYSEEDLKALRDFETSDRFAPAVKAALRLAEKMSTDAHRVSDADVAELKRYYSEPEIVEIGCVIGLANYFNRFTTAFRVDISGTDERYDDYRAELLDE